MRSDFAVWVDAMAAAAVDNGASLASTTTSIREQSPGVRSQHSFEDRFTVPFLLPGSKIERRNSIKAQQMLGLVTHVRQTSGGSQRMSITRARSRSEERLRLESMDVGDQPRSPASERLSKRDSLKAQELLGLVTHVRTGREPKRASYTRTRSRSEERPLLYRQSFDSIEEPPSPTPVRPRPLSIVKKKEIARLSQTIGSPSSMPAEQPRPRTADRLPRQLSIITHREAPNPKPSPNIASPRSIGTNAYINFSRPLSQQQSPMPTQEHHPDIDPVRQRLSVAREDIGLPRTPSQANTSVQAKPIFERVTEVEKVKQDGTHSHQRPRRRSKVWTSLPMCLARLRKGSVSESNSPSKTGKKDGQKTPKTPLTEDNLRSHEFVVGSMPKPLNRQLIPTPLHSPLDTRNIFSKLDYDEKPLPTPPSSPSSVLGDGPPPTPLNSTDAPPNSTFRTPSITPTLHIATSINFQPDLAICEVCREAKGTLAFPVRQCTGKCRHPPHTCVTCIEQWISSCVETKGWDQCVCPECNERLSYEDVKFFATEDVFLRYDEMAARHALSQIPNFYWCLSPMCTSGQIHPWPLSTHPRFVCDECGHIYCLNHPSIPYHAGMSCPEYDAQLQAASPSSSTEQIVQKQKEAQEKEDEKMAKEIGKRCPNAFCGWWIEKNEGCDHMTCTKCNFEFCWVCSAPFSIINKKGTKFHRLACKYYG